MNIYKVDGHENSILPEGNWKLVWNDEFDGNELDTSKWDYRTCMMGKVHPAWVRDGVSLDGKGNLVFTLIEKDGKPVSAQLQTGYNFMDEPADGSKGFGSDSIYWPIGKLHENLYLKKYGYFECRCRLQQHPEAWWSAFWIQSPMIGASLDPATSGTELDIMECFNTGEIAAHNAFTGGYAHDLRKKSVGGISDGSIDQTVFHRFGMKWGETGYTFYIDGKEDGHISENISHIPEFILISTEVKGYRREGHTAVKEAYDAIGDTFVVDYIRVFDKD